MAGDVALWHALQVHGVVMNGGLAHGIEVFGCEPVQHAAAGWEYFGRRDVARLLRDALEVVQDMPDDPDARDRYFTDGWTEEQAERLEDLGDAYADDDALDSAFRQQLRRHPEDFAPTG